MFSGKHGLNVIEVNGTSMLLTLSGGGDAVHLTAPAGESETGCTAVPDYYFDHEDDTRTLTDYNHEALCEPQWREATLCGREWAVMAGGDGGPVGRFGEVAFAPTCRRCLASIDRHFPKPPADPRLAIVAKIAADTVVEQRGFAEIHGVPGDQQNELRAKVRSLIRERTGYSVRTFVSRAVVYVECQEIYDQRAEEGLREAAEALDAFYKGEPPPPRDRYWVISWDAWDIT